MAKFRPFSFNLVLQLFLWGGLLTIAYYGSSRSLLAALWGALILLQIAIHLRHFRNLILFRFAYRSDGIKGQVEYADWLSLRMSSREMFLVAALFLIVYLFSDSLFVLGGAVSCFLTGFRHALLSKRAAAASLSGS